MERLIDANELWKQMSELREKRAEESNMTGDRTVCATWNDAVGLIKNAPTIDAEPVKHGQWINDKGLYKCSVCNELWCHWWVGTVPIERMNEMMHFCPNCGAKMTLD